MEEVLRAGDNCRIVMNVPRSAAFPAALKGPGRSARWAETVLGSGG